MKKPDVAMKAEQVSIDFGDGASDVPDPKARGARFATVVLSIPGNQGYSYKIPQELQGSIQPGSYVLVPLGPRRVRGLVWALSDEVPGFDPVKLRSIEAVLQLPAIKPALLNLLDWCSRYTLSAPGDLLRLVQPPAQVLDPPKNKVMYRFRQADAPMGLTLSPARKALFANLDKLPLEVLTSPKPMSAWTALTGASEAVLRALTKISLAGHEDTALLEAISAPALTVLRQKPSAGSGTKAPLTIEQQRAFKQLDAKIDQGFSVSLLDGVTGSGKTHVYLGLIKKVIARGQSVLVLLPEIALATDILHRLQQETGLRLDGWHSEVKPGAKARTWNLLLLGSNLLVVGARSALWLPFQNLGLIIVDEEHDSSYKQSEGARFNARDMAIVRAKLEGCPLVLASATPALETFYHGQSGKYGVARLLNRRGQGTLPRVNLIDLCRSRLPSGRWISEPVEHKIEEVLKQGRQVLLYLNKRGYAPLSLCKACGHRFACRDCAGWLVEHRLRARLTCHHCGLAMPKPTQCPECKEEDSLMAVGPGVERLQEEAQALFPEARIGVASSDSLHNVARMEDFITKVHEGVFDILIGTQILAKGHNFPHLALVAIMDADIGLQGGDPRAAEHSFQALTQIAGRAGRFDDKGQVLIQTTQVDDPLMQALSKHDREGFMQHELLKRQAMQLPPFGRLSSLILSDPDPLRVDKVCRDLINTAPNPGEDHRILGPAPAPIPLIRGRHRRRFLLQSFGGAKPQSFIKVWIGALKIPASTHVTVDIDPYSFL